MNMVVHNFLSSLIAANNAKNSHNTSSVDFN